MITSGIRNKSLSPVGKQLCFGLAIKVKVWVSLQKINKDRYPKWPNRVCVCATFLILFCSHAHTCTQSLSIWQWVWVGQSVSLTVTDASCDVWFTLCIWSSRYRGSRACRDISSAHSHSVSLWSTAKLNKHRSITNTQRVVCFLCNCNMLKSVTSLLKAFYSACLCSEIQVLHNSIVWSYDSSRWNIGETQELLRIIFRQMLQSIHYLLRHFTKNS